MASGVCGEVEGVIEEVLCDYETQARKLLNLFRR
jgi:hypothetical protein